MGTQSPIVITVRGEKRMEVEPELAHVELVVRAEGTERAPLVPLVSEVAATVIADLDVLKEAGAVSAWSSRGLTVGEFERYAPGEQQHAHFAEVRFRASFIDFDALNEYVVRRAHEELIQFTGVTWALTPATRQLKEAEAAEAAVEVAIERARSYARPAGRSDVVLEQIADLGLLEEAAKGHDGVGRAHLGLRAGGGDGERPDFLSSADFAAVPDFLRAPDVIVVTAAVEARFVAS